MPDTELMVDDDALMTEHADGVDAAAQDHRKYPHRLSV